MDDCLTLSDLEDTSASSSTSSEADEERRGEDSTPGNAQTSTASQDIPDTDDEEESEFHSADEAEQETPRKAANGGLPKPTVILKPSTLKGKEKATALPQQLADGHASGGSGSAPQPGEPKPSGGPTRSTKKHLLDLPVDILNEILKEITHTSDLTALARCSSAFHKLAIPLIYSRFDIVWPDDNPSADPRSGVDALTYGLSTLVMAHEIFGDREPAGKAKSTRKTVQMPYQGELRNVDVEILGQRRRRLGNCYAEYTRKFSIGNGPPDFVAKYMITEEGGKMLGTLVALAIGRMRRLESFVWDMPTGLLREVWLALASLQGRDDGHDCRLEKVWIRWHDSHKQPSHSGHSVALPPAPPPISHLPPPPTGAPPPLGVPQIPLPPITHHNTHHSYPPPPALVVRPTFSILPPLKSLSVLDIDQLAYLDEMSTLIGRSRNQLRELRVGIARHALNREWTTAWDGKHIHQVAPSGNPPGFPVPTKRLGGVLGILVGHVYDLRRDRSKSPVKRAKTASSAGPSSAAAASGASNGSSGSGAPIITHLKNPAGLNVSGEDVVQGQENIKVPAQTQASLDKRKKEHGSESFEGLSSAGDSATKGNIACPAIVTTADAFQASFGNQKLHLDILELERIQLYVPVLQKAIDWTRLTSLTILGCLNHDALWKALRRQFAPKPTANSPTSPTAPKSPLVPTHEDDAPAPEDYVLKLKKIHTNGVSPALLPFLKEALPPNSLEVLFLQEGKAYTSHTTIDQIFKNAVKHHRGSLKKLLIDSSEKTSHHPDHITSHRWRRWMFNRQMLRFITSGQVPNLRELGFSLAYRDWHFFLQRLPQIPHLRSLYIPHVGDHPHVDQVTLSKELADQILDIVMLKPEIELCYMGILKKCFEILENKRESLDEIMFEPPPPPPPGPMPPPPAPPPMDPGMVNIIDPEDPDNDDDDDDDDDDEIDDLGLQPPLDLLDTESDTSADSATEPDDDESDYGEDTDHLPDLKLREILFYDDKVAIFKARHGRL